MILSDLGRRRRVRRAPVRPSPGGDLRALGVRGLLGSVFPARLLLGDPEPRRARTRHGGNALMQGAENLATLVGPVLAGARRRHCSARTRCTGSTRSASSSPRCCSSASATGCSPSVPARIGRTHWREVRSGLSLVRNNRYLSSIFLIWSWATLAYAGINVAEIVLTKDAYGTGYSASASSSRSPPSGIVLGNRPRQAGSSSVSASTAATAPRSSSPPRAS